MQVEASVASAPQPHLRRWARDMRNTSKQMEVKVQIDLSVFPADKHMDALRSAARYLSNDRESVQVTVHPELPKSMLAGFTIPRAREMDVVDKIMRECAMFMEDYQDQTVWFPKKPRKRKPRRAQPESGHVRK